MKKVKKEKTEYPIATVALYGPDDRRTTKVVVGIIYKDDGEPLLKSWVSSVVLTDPKIRKQILDHLEEQKVKKVILTEGNIGCPHEEGKDYPIGESCHFCSFWKRK